MSTTQIPNMPFGAQLIGRTEKSLDAFLKRVLADSGLTEPEYVALRVCADHDGGSRAEAVATLAGAFRKGDEHAAGLVDQLAAAGAISSDPAAMELTPSGRELYARLAADTAAIGERLWGDLPAEDLAVAARVLSEVLRRGATEKV